MILEELLTVLSQAKLGVIGRSLFINQMPVSAKGGILLFTPPGGFEIDPELTNYYHSELELVVRAGSPTDAIKLGEKASKALTLTEKKVGELVFKYCRPTNLPFLFPVSDGDYYEASVVFEFACYKQTDI